MAMGDTPKYIGKIISSLAGKKKNKTSLTNIERKDERLISP